MVIGNFCEGCGQRVILPQIPRTVSPMPKLQPRVLEIAIAIIATVIIAAFLFFAAMIVIFSEPDVDIETPKGSLLAIEDQNTPGRYYTTFAGSVKNKDLEIRITDVSTGMSTIMDEPVDGEIVNCPSGFSLTYDDANSNHMLDASDTLLVNNGASGDEIEVVYKPNGEIIAMETLL